ncbi:hypothetical protein N8077_01190 [Myxococcota bacterium]|nr:hypothetical protein [Myxococcota bacterium]
MKRNALFGWSLVTIFVLSGCTYVPTRSMAYDPLVVPVSGREFPAGVVAVRTLEDARPARAYPSGFSFMFLTYIPLIPYVKIPYERLDDSDEMTAASRGEITPRGTGFPKIIMESVSKDLKLSGLFEDVVFVETGAVPDGADFVLEGTLKSTEFDSYATSYMLGMPGVLLWFVPIPIGGNAGVVDADLRLLDREGNEVWAGPLSGRGSKWFTLYNSGGAAISSRFSLEIAKYGRNSEGIDGESLWAYYASAIRSGMADVKSSMAESLGSPVPPAP